jgi:chitodextrinase
VFPGDTAQADFAIQCVERLHVATRSTGPGVDRNGYVVVVENSDGSADSVAIGTADTVAMAGVEPGEHTIRLADVDPNCVAPASVQRLVSARDSTLVSFSVSCPGPAAPVGLRSTRVETARIDLAWDAAPGGRPIAFYRLYRSTNSATAATIIADSLPGLTHVDAGLSNYTRYAYQVAAVDPNGLVGPKSTVLQVRTLDGTPPNAPSGLTAVALSSSAINLDWASANDPESGIARYRVFRDGVLIDSTTGTSYLSRGLAPVTSYRYEVQAVNGGGLSGPLSGPASATTLDNPDTTPPSAPTGLSATPAGMTRIDLAWNAAADPETGVASYHVYRDGVRIATTTALAYADTGLTAGTTYTYEVSAVNGVGLEGARSAPATATTDPPPVSTGDLRIVVRTSGTNIPPTGFQLQIAGTGPPLVRQVAPNDTVVVTDLAAQVYTVTLVLPSNCTVLDGTVSRTIDVLAGATARTTYLVSCQ